jgi:pyruvate dehydrogenase E2 component (dihydrolipoamide acetyltransferase)
VAEVIMPQMGESIAEGTVTTWLKKVGERVERDEPLFEISTDKVDAEIPSPAAGVLLEIKVQPGQTVPINTVVAIVGDGDAKAAPPRAVAKAAPAANKPAPAPAPAAAKPAVAPAVAAVKPAPAPAPADDGPVSLEDRRRTKSSPVVRKIASEHGVDITQLSGSGISGRVTKDDILAHLDKGGAPVARPATSGGAPAQMLPGAAPSMPGMGAVPDSYRGRVLPGDRVEDMSMMRVKIAEHMVLSKRISAHVQTVWDMDFTHVAKLRAKHKARWQEQHGVNLTYTAFIMKATVDALKSFPVINASVDGNKVIYHQHINLGIAVALDWGLIVPVIQAADELNLLGLTRRANDLAERARLKKLKPDEVQNGTFTITNPGVFGPLFGIPVINQPQVAIMGVGAVEKRPVVVETDTGDAIAIRTKAYQSLSFDHRIIDGAVADQFMGKVKKILAEFDEAEL